MSIFDEKNEVKSAWLQWGQKGDYIAGTLMSKREVANNLPNAKSDKQMVYEIKAKDGSFHRILEDKTIDKEATKISEGEMWNIGGKSGIDAQLRNIRIGQIIGLKFMELVPSKTKGYNPTKVIRCFTSGEMDKEIMENIGAEAQSAIDFDNM